LKFEHALAKPLRIKDWEITNAPLHSDIIWQNFFSNSFIQDLKEVMLNLLVFILALTFVTPVYLMEFLKKSGLPDTLQFMNEMNNSYLTKQAYA
jgi:hypothetical protein